MTGSLKGRYVWVLNENRHENHTLRKPCNPAFYGVFSNKKEADKAADDHNKYALRNITAPRLPHPVYDTQKIQIRG